MKIWKPDCLVINNSATEFLRISLFPVDARTGEKAERLEAMFLLNSGVMVFGQLRSEDQALYQALREGAA